MEETAVAERESQEKLARTLGKPVEEVIPNGADSSLTFAGDVVGVIGSYAGDVGREVFGGSLVETTPGTKNWRQILVEKLKKRAGQEGGVVVESGSNTK